MPQWVINNGPEASRLVSINFTVALDTDIPNKSLILISLILKVNNEGTGDITA